MLNVKKTLTKILDDFHGCDNSRTVDYGAVTSITPTHNGWLRSAGTTNSGQSIAPIIEIQLDGTPVGRGIGLTASGSALMCFAPVKAGKTYTINIYRATVSKSVLYY